MNFSVIQDEVAVLMQDESDDIVDRIPSAINEAYERVGTEISLPGLKGIAPVDTVVNQAYTALPDAVNSRVLRVIRGGVPVTQQPNLQTLMDLYPSWDSTGDVTDVAVEGTVLWYHPVPTSRQTLTLLGYRKPDPLVYGSDIPEHLPTDSIQRKCLIHGACMVLYEIIEDGLEAEAKTNTQWHTAQFNAGLNEMREYLGRRGHHVGTSAWLV